jgi:DNA-directed RNA polymerase subunit RPC12/RpoP
MPQPKTTEDEETENQFPGYEHLAKPFKELNHEDMELLWIVAEYPEATMDEIGRAYGFADGSVLEDELDELLDVEDKNRDEILPSLFEDDGPFWAYDPIERAIEVSQELEEMIDEDEEDDESEYECSHCGDGFSTEQALKIHEGRWCDNATETVECQECGEEFEDDQEVRKHQEEAHSDDEPQLSSRQKAVLQAILENPEAQQSVVGSEAGGISQAETSRLTQDLDGFDWETRVEDAERILKEAGEETTQDSSEVDEGQDEVLAKPDDVVDESLRIEAGVVDQLAETGWAVVETDDGDLRRIEVVG